MGLIPDFLKQQEEQQQELRGMQTHSKHYKYGIFGPTQGNNTLYRAFTDYSTRH